VAVLRPVLVIDDDDSIRELVEMALRDEGYDVLTAQHGGAALSLLGRESPGLILLDMRMPVMDGWEFARLYRAQPGPHVPIVVITAAHEVAERAAQVAADDFLAKPFNIEDLVEIVERHAR
jgi:CheY-like chemotaxis protein